MEEVAEAVEDDSVQIDKFTNDAEESAIKLLAVRLVVLSKHAFYIILTISWLYAKLKENFKT